MVQPNEPTMTKERRSISFDPDVLAWVDQHVKDHYEYKDRSHFIEVLIKRYRDTLEKAGTL